MLRFIDKIPYDILIPLTIFMLLIPFFPMPHLAEKLLMLKNGAPVRPIDIFDIFFHLAPLFLLVAKKLRG